ncbi:hypothetical protein OAU50_07535, partial [Planctomycetota bacterium]|nr:hypothetical protein [Planctomycetota bacterium]
MYLDNLSVSIREDVFRWLESDLTPSTQTKYPTAFNRCIAILSWLCANKMIVHWYDIRPSMIQMWANSEDAPSIRSCHDYVKGLRKWLAWHERDEIDRPILSTRIKGILPPVMNHNPFFLEPEQWQTLIQRSHWVFKGSRAITYTDSDGRNRVADMVEWPKGLFSLWLRLSYETGMRPWEVSFLSWNELFLQDDLPFAVVVGNSARSPKTSESSRPIKLTQFTSNALRDLKENASHEFVFAVPTTVNACGWRARRYSQIWRSFRQEL